jgi:hypothetical protein
MYSPLFGGKVLKNYEHTTKDVCKACNSTISVYDSAGAELARFVHTHVMGLGIRIPADATTLGWLIKTHLNFLRSASVPHPTKHNAAEDSLYERLLRRTAIPKGFCPLYAVIWDVDSSVWDINAPIWLPLFEHNAYTGGGSILQREGVRIVLPTEILVSYFRMKWLATYLFLPTNDSYADFDRRCERAFRSLQQQFGVRIQKIDTEKVVADGYLRVNAKIPAARIRQFISQARTVRVE